MTASQIRWTLALSVFAVFGCSGWERECSAKCAADFGADWAIAAERLAEVT
jgi:hypothetical protein